MIKTTHYKWPYFSGTDKYAADAEQQRWQGVEAQVLALMTQLGNGVISGWGVSGTVGGTSLTIALGDGVISSLYAVDTTGTTLDVSGAAESSTYLVLALTTDTTPYDFGVSRIYV